MAEHADKVRGALLGLAIGDALGMPANGMTPYEVVRSYQSLDGYFARRDKGMEAGEYTANTQMALVLAKTLSLTGSMEGAPEAYLSMKAAKELSPRVRESLDRLRAGLGEQSPRGGSSADFAPRVIPAGLMGFLSSMSEGRLLRSCRDAAFPTHRNKPAILAGFAVAKIVMESVARSDEINSPYRLYESGDSLLSQVAGIIRMAEARLPPEEATDDLFWMRLRDVMSMLSSRRSPAEACGTFGQRNDMRDLIPTAIFCFLRAPDDYHSCVEAAGLGGNASLRAGLVGAMVGAFAGEGAFPLSLREGVENSSRVLLLADSMISASRGENA